MKNIFLKLTWKCETVFPVKFDAVSDDFMVLCDDGSVAASQMMLGGLSTRLEQVMLQMEAVKSSTLVLHGASSIAEV